MADSEIPESLRGYIDVKPPENTPPARSPVPDSLQGYMAGSPPGATLAYAVGKTPQLAIPESPFSPLERAAFGYARNPNDQMKYLEEKVGKGNVQLIKMDADNANFVVRTEDGNWKQVDPHGISDIPMQVLSGLGGDYGQFGQAFNRIKNFNLRNTIGGAAQFIGEKGAVSAGAALGAGEAISAGAPAILASGPYAPLTALGLGVAGGVAGGGVASYLDAGVREASQFVQDATGTEILGAHKYNTEDLSHQVLGDMIFGGAQELAGPFLKASAKGVGLGAAKIFSKAAEAIGDTPEAKQGLASAIKLFSGMKDGLARAWADDPKAVADYIPTALKDKTNNTDNLLIGQKAKVNDFFDSAQGAMRSLGKQYDVIEKKASSKIFNALEPDKSGSNPVMDAFQKLQEEKYIDSKGDIIPSGTNEITRDTTGTNGQALKKVTDDFRVLLSKNGEASYKDLRIMERNIENNLFGQNQVSDGTLRNILGQMRSAINTVQSKGLYDVDPGLSGELAQLNAKYGPAKELLGDLGQKSKDQRLDAFLKQLIRDDGSYNAEMMNSVTNLLGIDNPTKDILHMEVAKHSAPWFTGSGSANLFGVKLPASPGMTRKFMAPAGFLSQPIVEDAGDVAVREGLKKLSGVYRALPAEARLDLIKNPQAISVANGMITGTAVKADQDEKSGLLQQAGDFQASQFGKLMKENSVQEGK